MFQFPAFPTLSRHQEMNPGRFPDLGHLRIKARLAAPRSFSQLCHALHRLWTPRHPPCTLCSLTTLFLYCVVLHVLPIHLYFQRTRSATRADRLLYFSFQSGPCAASAAAWYHDVPAWLPELPTASSRGMVEATGFEPTTAWLQTRCSTN